MDDCFVEVPRLGRKITGRELHVSMLVAFQALGYDCPTPDQKEVITSFVKGHDLFVVLPTGSGKSLCFVSLPLVFEQLLKPTDQVVSLIVVVTPL